MWSQNTWTGLNGGMSNQAFLFNFTLTSHMPVVDFHLFTPSYEWRIIFRYLKKVSKFEREKVYENVCHFIKKREIHNRRIVAGISDIQ